MAWNSPMKPETIARRARDAKERHEQRALTLTSRLKAKSAEENDPNGFWTEMLSDHLASRARDASA